MKNRLRVILFLLAFVSCAYAETLILRTGARIKGTIIFQNEEVVIIRDAEGARFQYPKSDVAEITEETEEEEVVEEQETIETNKKVSILLELGGGGAFIPKDAKGGNATVNLLVGSHHLGDKHIFVGAGVGYRGLFLGGEKYNFLPVQAAIRMPLIEQQHAPVFGLALGYGVALSKDYLGGLYADLDFGYRYQINDKTALSVVAFAQFLQAQIRTHEIIDETIYTNTTGRSFFSTGLKFGVYF